MKKLFKKEKRKKIFLSDGMVERERKNKIKYK